MADVSELIIEYLALFLALMLVMPLHEFAHAFAAVKSGDDTPRLAGRYTLNPFAHFDLIGLLMLLVARFGWAKPVPINPYNFRNLKWGYFWTSIAGVLTNLITAFLIYPVYVLFTRYIVFDFLLFDELFIIFLWFVYAISLNLVVFNLIPVYPLD
ncbi:MAG: site-2 protease family protein, partial [Clostridia bacterium]|nr:site-2 protease family protein [Clostridia bacterium]